MGIAALFEDAFGRLEALLGLFVLAWLIVLSGTRPTARCHSHRTTRRALSAPNIPNPRAACDVAPRATDITRGRALANAGREDSRDATSAEGK